VNILAIETATTACAIALRLDSGEEFEVVLDNQRHHTETLTPGIRDLLARVQLAPKDLERVVVDRGPGLYTGLRVGVATAIGLSLGASADLVSVTSLELLAHGASRRGARGTFVSVVDGRRGELFVQTFSTHSVSQRSRRPRPWLMSGRDVTTTSRSLATGSRGTTPSFRRLRAPRCLNYVFRHPSRH
jgi:tRNA threonylcarbamoyladenosine biosynthesis protein TsaB